MIKSRAGRRPVYPWDAWMDGHWHLARRGAEFACELPSFRMQLQARASLGGLRVGTRAIPGGFAFRFLAEGEKLFDRDPEVDGISVDSNEIRRSDGRRDVYPWEKWASGEWRIARQGEDFDCSVVGFQASLRRKATAIGKRVFLRVVPTQDSIFGNTPAVFFIFHAPGFRIDLQEAGEALRHERRA